MKASLRLVQAGVTKRAFGALLKGQHNSYEFRIYRDEHGRCWLVATKGGNKQECELHQEDFNARQWGLVVELAADAPAS